MPVCPGAARSPLVADVAETLGACSPLLLGAEIPVGRATDTNLEVAIPEAAALGCTNPERAAEGALNRPAGAFSSDPALTPSSREADTSGTGS